MPTTYTKEWADIFNPANVAFTKDISELKKRDPAAGGILKNELDAMHKVLMPAMDAMAAFDKINLSQPGDIKDADRLKAALKQFEANVKEAKAVVSKLESTTKKAASEITGLIDFKLTVKQAASDHRLPTPMKDVCPQTYRQLKVMKTGIVEVHAKAANLVNLAANYTKIAAINAEKVKQKAKVAGTEDEVNAKFAEISEKAALEQFKISFAAGMKSAMAKGATRIQKLKASPNAATYNTEMTNAGRDISQNVLNLTKLRANPKFKNSTLAKKVADPAPFAAQLTAFANGAKRTVAPNASDAAVRQLIDEFTDLYKRLAVAYKDVLAGKFG